MVVIDEIAERVRSWFKGKPQPPYKVDLFMTERCNLKCLFCNFPSIDKKRHERELTEEELLKIVEYSKKNGVRVVGILGGEPFCRKSTLLSVMKKIKECDIDGSMVTNGTLLDEKTILELVKIEWDLIRFSIDGIEKTHDFLRGKKGCFKLVTEAVKKFNEVKKKLGKFKPAIEMNAVLCNKNYKELPEIIELASNIGCDHVYFLPMIEFTEFSKKLKISDEVKGYLLEGKDVSEKLAVSTNIDQIIKDELVAKSNKMEEVILPSEELKNKTYIPCFLPWYGMNIDAVGNVTPCCNLSPMGENIREKSLDEIWLGKKFNKIRDRMLERDLPKECSRCCVPLIDENRILRGKVL